MLAVFIVLVPWPWVLAEEDCRRESRFRDCRLDAEEDVLGPQFYYRPYIPPPPPLIDLARDRRIEIIAAADAIL